MARVIGEVTGPAGAKHQLLAGAIQKALEDAPPPPPHTDVQRFKVLMIEFEHGGFVDSTKTRVTLDMQPGALPSRKRNTREEPDKKRRKGGRGSGISDTAKRAET